MEKKFRLMVVFCVIGYHASSSTSQVIEFDTKEEADRIFDQISNTETLICRVQIFKLY